MDVKKIKEGLKKYQQTKVDHYVAYLQKLLNQKQKNGQLKNPWMKQRKEDYLIRIFKLVSDDGLCFDGEDITLQSTGVFYGYQAFKNKMLLAYPESIIDVQLVHQGDSFNFRKSSGHVEYNHEITAPFEKKKLVGGYCVIKNKRGQFLTLLSDEDIDKHRQAAKTDSIWSGWFNEMALKTLIKKGCKQHFKDTFETIESLDNENYDLEKPIEDKQEKPTISEDQVRWLFQFAKDNNIDTPQKRDILKEKYGYDVRKNTPEEFEVIKQRMIEGFKK